MDIGTAIISYLSPPIIPPKPNQGKISIVFPGASAARANASPTQPKKTRLIPTIYTKPHLPSYSCLLLSLSLIHHSYSLRYHTHTLSPSHTANHGNLPRSLLPPQASLSKTIMLLNRYTFLIFGQTSGARRGTILPTPLSSMTNSGDTSYQAIISLNRAFLCSWHGPPTCSFWGRAGRRRGMHVCAIRD